VVAAIQRQAAKLIHMSGTDFYYENMVALAEKLAAIVPGDSPKRVYFGNSGTEAIEAALKLARYHSGRGQFIAFVGAFHGRTMGSLALTGSKSVQKRGFFPVMPTGNMRGRMRPAHRKRTIPHHRPRRRRRCDIRRGSAGRGRLRRAAEKVLRRAA
jgi:4-aminobutyrate aminotransferase-like enzyme